MHTGASQLVSTIQNRRGVALPVAVLSLLAVTVLVTSVLLTSATEVTLSGAHQDATRRLYTAEGAIEAYVAQRQLALAPDSVRYLPPGGSAQDSVIIRVALLAEVPNPTPNFPADSTLSISAVPVRGGRQVVAMVDLVNRELVMTIDAGLVSGDKVALSGGATVSDGSDSQICADSVGGKAIQTTSDASVSTAGGAQIIGENEKIDYPAGDLVQQLFGTQLQNLINRADIKFAPGTFNQKVTSLSSVANRSNPQSTPYNWGCPADVFLSCEADSDREHLPLVVIDASTTTCTKQGVCTTSWGTVEIDLSHGQGMLIVYNGNLAIRGQFAYKGVIIVEGTFTIEGKGSADPQTSPKIEGAVIGLGRNAQGTQSTVADNTGAGNATIRYNRCAINLVQTQLEKKVPVRRMDGRTFAWFEVIR